MKSDISVFKVNLRHYLTIDSIAYDIIVVWGGNLGWIHLQDTGIAVTRCAF